MTPKVSHSNSHTRDNQYVMEDKIKELGGAHSYQISLDMVG